MLSSIRSISSSGKLARSNTAKCCSRVMYLVSCSLEQIWCSLISRTFSSRRRDLAGDDGGDDDGDVWINNMAISQFARLQIRISQYMKKCVNMLPDSPYLFAHFCCPDISPQASHCLLSMSACYGWWWRIGAGKRFSQFKDKLATGETSYASVRRPSVMEQWSRVPRSMSRAYTRVCARVQPHAHTYAWRICLKLIRNG